jgi:YVTN family beta-propeller protein
LLAIAAFVSCLLGSVQTRAQNAYITNDGSNSVSVIATARNRVTATIAVGSEPFGVAVSPDGCKVYVANGASNNVSVVIAAATHTVNAVITVGTGPVAFGVFNIGPSVAGDEAALELSRGIARDGQLRISKPPPSATRPPRHR